MKTYCYLLFLLFTICCSSPAEKNTLTYTKAEFGENWPFSVNEIKVYCSGYKEIYCKTSNGKVYALNGTAKGASSDDPTVSDIDEIWLDDPNWAGLKIPYTDFIAEGLKICEQK